MSCDKAAQIHAYHDDALSEAERAAMESHIAACDECRELLEDLQRLTSMFATVPLPEMPQRALSRMYGSYHEARRAQDRGVRLLAEWLSAAAAVVLLVVHLTAPSPRQEIDAGWVDTMALIPPAQLGDTPNSQLIQVAEWMATDLELAERR